MTTHFRDSKDGFTLGIELETQLVDRSTMGLVQRSPEVISSLASFEDSIKHELMLSNLEVISGVCPDLDAAREDLAGKVLAAMEAASRHDTLLCCASTHPVSRWRDQGITDDPRYNRLMETLQMVARRFNIFGLHVHVGVDGGERCIYIMNRLMYHLPHLLAVSVNSPFWEGEDSGLASYRSKVFESLPIAGLPFYFKDWDDYSRLVKMYLATGTIKTMRELWWDARPHPDFGTIEVRVCDIPSTIGETLSIAALVQALVKRFSEDYDSKVPFVRPHSAVVRENKWRACRYGLDGEFITEDGLAAVPAREAVGRLVDELAPHAEDLGSASYLEGVGKILDEGTGAERQLRVWKETGDLGRVVEDYHRRLASEVGFAAGGLK